MSDTVREIKERLNIVDVVGAYVKLTRAGKYWKGLSPFTKERTPSFFVTPDRGLYHCFSTGKGGDMFTFVEEMESVDFKGALKILADKAGVEIVREASGERDERAEVYAALTAATEYFTEALKHRPDAAAYLTKRGLSAETIRTWRIGYAPKEWRALKETLMSQGYSEATLLKAGLIKRPDAEVGSKKETASYDRFRGRIMFPLFDVSGRVIAFSGRIFDEEPGLQSAKYLNSPEGPLFDKSRALYGIHEAKTGIRTLGFTMLVEGQVDLVLAHQVGYKNTVATSGTALTASHVEILKRYSQNILLSYDGDAAGIRATHRAAELLLPQGMNAKVVALPAGVDPADSIQSDVQVFKDAVKHARTVIDFFVAHILTTVPDLRTQRLEIGSLVLPLVAKIPNALEQSHFVTRIAETLGVEERVVQTELDKIARAGEVGRTPTALQQDPFFAEDQREKLLYGIWRTLADDADERAGMVRELFVDVFGEERFVTRSALGSHEDEAARISASENFFTLYQTRDAQDQFLAELAKEAARSSTKVKEQYDALKRDLRLAEASGDAGRVTELMQALADLSKKLQ
jgi:DNA primase